VSAPSMSSMRPYSDSRPKRVNFELSDKAFKELEEISKASNRSLTETVRLALSMIKLTFQEKNTRLLLQSDSGLREIVIPGMMESSTLPLPSILLPKPTPELEPLVKPASGFHIGVFGESTEPNRIIDIRSALTSFEDQILHSREDLSRLTPAQLEELVLDRLMAMRYLADRAGHAFRADGGIDIVFKSRPGYHQFPVIGAVQVKHKLDPMASIGPRVVRELAGVLSQQFHGQFNMAMVVTNTYFTQAAHDFVKTPEVFLRLKEGDDIMNWVKGNFGADADGIPDRVTLPTGIIVDLNQEKPKK
jgi:hypothetical protein